MPLMLDIGVIFNPCLVIALSNFSVELFILIDSALQG